MKPIALLCAMTTVCCWGIGAIFDKLALEQVRPMSAIVIRTFFTILGLVALSLFVVRWDEIRAVPIRVHLYLAASALPAGMLGMLLYYVALKYDDASRIVPLTSTYPLAALLLAVFVLREHVDWRRVVGALLIVAGILLLNASRPMENTSAERGKRASVEGVNAQDSATTAEEDGVAEN